VAITGEITQACHSCMTTTSLAIPSRVGGQSLLGIGLISRDEANAGNTTWYEGRPLALYRAKADLVVRQMPKWHPSIVTRAKVWVYTLYEGMLKERANPPVKGSCDGVPIHKAQEGHRLCVCSRWLVWNAVMPFYTIWGQKAGEEISLVWSTSSEWPCYTFVLRGPAPTSCATKASHTGSWPCHTSAWVR
jgi:hypothetical protein